MPGLVLLADKPRRTLKYILAVATGIPCVNYKWIIQCCDKVTIVVSQLPHTHNCI